MTGQTPPVVRVENVSRWFGSVVAVSEVNLEIGPGITGLLGPNGAGKTTLLSLVAGLADPSEGSVEVLGEPVRRNPALYRRMGVMTARDATYPFLTARQYVELNAQLQGVRDVGPAVDAAIDAVGLADAQARKIGGYSRGMRQRARLAATMVHNPELLILDEPLAGLDPRQRLQFMDLMRRFAGEGRSLLISSHVLEDVQELADEIVLLVAGRVAATGDYRAIRRKLNDRPYVVRIGSSNSRLLGAGLLEIESVESVSVDERGDLEVRSSDVAALQLAVPLVAQRHDIRLQRVEPLDDSLESVFEYLAQR